MVEQGTHKPLVGGSNPPSATSSPLADAVERGARALGILDGIPVVLAVSGGPDSMALLVGAAAIGAGHRWQLTVGHIDHGLRADSAADAAFVTDAASALGLRVTVRRVDVAALATAEHRSMEDAGRQARYRFLEELAAPLGTDALIVTAHTADDAAETILLRLSRGTGLRGLRGIPARRGRVVRPLLGERRAILRDALDAQGIAYLTDPTNADPSYAQRNRVRAELLPALERLNPQAVEALLRFGRLAAEDDDLLDGLALAELARRRSAGGALDWRDPPHRALGRRVLRLAIGEPAPSAERLEALLDAAQGPRGGVRIELGAGRVASVRERQIRIG